MGEHLEINSSVIAAQDADEPAHDVREHGRRQPALEANQCRFVRGRAHIRRQHIQLTAKIGTGVSLIVFKDRQHVAACVQFLLHCGNKAGQLTLDLLAAFCKHFLRLAALLEVKQRRRSITGKTQKEVMQKLTAATAAIDSGTYIQPSKQTLGQWLDIWEKTYLGGVKPRTRVIYADNIRLHIKPALGAVRLEALNTHEIQQFYNALGEPSRTRKAGLAPKTIKDIHGVLHKALRQAVEIGYLRFNPADVCKLPRVERKELAPLDDAQITAFLQIIKGSRFETLLTVTLFTGMREGEVLGLTWDNVDFKAGTVTISKQALLHESEAGGGFQLGSTKNGKSRTIAPASAVMALLKQHKSEQAKQRLKVGKLWGNTALVFTDEIGRPLTKATVYRAFKKAAAEIGCPDARFHDLRHSYAVDAIRSGDDIKTVQGNLGHATAAFTLDVYGHVTEQMKQESAARMDAYIKAVSK